ncbi:hypothetical protein BC833DRAFT_625837 [Globomyces pollinis-pini]|nr:hypothetical protein BC833DRAFT_625837 [Globomyces pollinis-pini]
MIADCDLSSRLCIETSSIVLNSPLSLYWPKSQIPVDIDPLNLSIYLYPGSSIALSNYCNPTSRKLLSTITIPYTNDTASGLLSTTKITIKNSDSIRSYLENSNQFFLLLKDQNDRVCMIGPDVRGQYSNYVALESPVPTVFLPTPTGNSSTSISDSNNWFKDNVLLLVIVILLFFLLITIIVLACMFYRQNANRQKSNPFDHSPLNDTMNSLNSPNQAITVVRPRRDSSALTPLAMSLIDGTEPNSNMTYPQFNDVYTDNNSQSASDPNLVGLVQQSDASSLHSSLTPFAKKLITGSVHSGSIGSKKPSSPDQPLQLSPNDKIKNLGVTEANRSSMDTMVKTQSYQSLYNTNVEVNTVSISDTLPRGNFNQLTGHFQDSQTNSSLLEKIKNKEEPTIVIKKSNQSTKTILSDSSRYFSATSESINTESKSLNDDTEELEYSQNSIEQQSIKYVKLKKSLDSYFMDRPKRSIETFRTGEGSSIDSYHTGNEFKSDNSFHTVDEYSSIDSLSLNDPNTVLNSKQSHPFLNQNTSSISNITQQPVTLVDQPKKPKLTTEGFVYLDNSDAELDVLKASDTQSIAESLTSTIRGETTVDD